MNYLMNLYYNVYYIAFVIEMCYMLRNLRCMLYYCAYIFTVLCAHRLLSMNRHLGGARVKKCSQNNCLTVCKLDVFELIVRGTD